MHTHVIRTTEDKLERALNEWSDDESPVMPVVIPLGGQQYRVVVRHQEHEPDAHEQFRPHGQQDAPATVGAYDRPNAAPDPAGQDGTAYGWSGWVEDPDRTWILYLDGARLPAVMWLDRDPDTGAVVEGSRVIPGEALELGRRVTAMLSGVEDTYMDDVGSGFAPVLPSVEVAIEQSKLDDRRRADDPVLTDARRRELASFEDGRRGGLQWGAAKEWQRWRRVLLGLTVAPDDTLEMLDRDELKDAVREIAEQLGVYSDTENLPSVMAFVRSRIGFLNEIAQIVRDRTGLPDDAINPTVFRDALAAYIAP